jgi:DNA-binding transcriptional LysR family regulator
VPDAITPDYAARQPLVLEHESGAVNVLVMQWLAKELPLRREPMRVGIVEAAKQSVIAGLGISIVPDVALAKPPRGIIVRPLEPPVPCTLGLIEPSQEAEGAGAGHRARGAARGGARSQQG